MLGISFGAGPLFIEAFILDIPPEGLLGARIGDAIALPASLAASERRVKVGICTAMGNCRSSSTDPRKPCKYRMVIGYRSRPLTTVPAFTPPTAVSIASLIKPDVIP